MFEAENENAASEAASESEYGYAGEFKNESIYSDAHYTPAGEGPVPPRYYTPPEPKKAEKRPRSGKGGRIAGLIALCLVCALLGGLAGAGFMGRSLDARVDALEEARAEQAITEVAQAAADSAAEDARPVTAGKIAFLPRDFTSCSKKLAVLFMTRS